MSKNTRSKFGLDNMSSRNKLGLDNSMLKTKGKKMYEDATEYGEFIPSFDSWLTLEEQKRNAEYLANIERIHKNERENEQWKRE